MRTVHDNQQLSLPSLSISILRKEHINDGNGHVAAAIWVTNSQAGCFYQTTFERVFKADGQWSSSYSFDDRDLPAPAKAASDAHSWIHGRNANAVTVEGGDAGQVT